MQVANRFSSDVVPSVNDIQFILEDNDKIEDTNYNVLYPSVKEGFNQPNIDKITELQDAIKLANQTYYGYLKDQGYEFHNLGNYEDSVYYAIHPAYLSLWNYNTDRKNFWYVDTDWMEKLPPGAIIQLPN